jgi:hypothetical protein
MTCCEDVISKIPALQENGQFSMARYQAALAAQGMSQAQFEAQLTTGSDAAAGGRCDC